MATPQAVSNIPSSPWLRAAMNNRANEEMFDRRRREAGLNSAAYRPGLKAKYRRPQGQAQHGLHHDEWHDRLEAKVVRESRR
jgi:hypothetical protein